MSRKDYGCNAWNNFLMWLNISKIRPIWQLMLFLGGIHYSSCLRQRCLILITWSICMWKTLISLFCLICVKKVITIGTLGVMDTYSRIKYCVCLKVSCMNSWLEKPVKKVYFDILELKKFRTFCIINSFGLKWNINVIKYYANCIMCHKVKSNKVTSS